MIIVVYLLILVAAFFFLIVLPQRRRMGAHQALMASLEAGDEVITAGGVYGTIRSLDDATIGLEVAPGVVITVARGAIAQKVLPRSDPAREIALDETGGDETDGEAP